MTRPWSGPDRRETTVSQSDSQTDTEEPDRPLGYWTSERLSGEDQRSKIVYFTQDAASLPREREIAVGTRRLAIPFKLQEESIFTTTRHMFTVHVLYRNTTTLNLSYLASPLALCLNYLAGDERMSPVCLVQLVSRLVAPVAAEGSSRLAARRSDTSLRSYDNNSGSWWWPAKRPRPPASYWPIGSHTGLWSFNPNDIIIC